MAKTEKVTNQPPRHDLFTFSRDDDGALHVTPHGKGALNKTFGSESPTVNKALMLQGYTTLKLSQIEDRTTDMRGFLPAIVREIGPRDGIERMPAVQMATTHIALMRQGGRMENSEQFPQFEAHERAYNKLARSYTAQVEALGKHRNGGKQTVRVEHVNVDRQAKGAWM